MSQKIDDSRDESFKKWFQEAIDQNRAAYIDELYDRLQEANREWLRINGETANGDDIKRAGRQTFHEVIGPIIIKAMDARRYPAY